MQLLRARRRASRAIRIRTYGPDRTATLLSAPLRAGRTDEVEPDRSTAIEQAISLAGEGDVVLIAGKGHEQGQEFADRTIPFDDREVARDALRRLGATA